MNPTRHASSRFTRNIHHGTHRQANAGKILRRYASSVVDRVEEGDIVFLKAGPTSKDFQLFTKPLKHGDRIGTHFGDFLASQIIGKAYRDLVFPIGGRRRALRIHAPSLDEYIKLTHRRVTPIYPQDCNLITSLLDIHVQPPSSPSLAPAEGPNLEILEAGTGHGSLTLHLARAIQAANPALPEVLLGFEPQDEDAASYYRTQLDNWKRRRRAVIHTVEKDGKNSLHARGVVAGFRRGIYAPHVDFYVQDVANFIEEQTRERLSSSNGNSSDSQNQADTTPDNTTNKDADDRSASNPYQLYSHIILDLPSTHTYMRLAARALKDGGALVVFCPSVTQVAQCVQMIREYKLPLTYGGVLEMGVNMVGGKSWDVRAAKVRKPVEDRVLKGEEDLAPKKIDDSAKEQVEERQDILTRLRRRVGHWLLQSDNLDTQSKNHDRKPKRPLRAPEEDERWEMVARPSAGLRIVGGGFVGIWHRKRNWELYEEEDIADLAQAAGAKGQGEAPVGPENGTQNNSSMYDSDSDPNAQPPPTAADTLSKPTSTPRGRRELASQRRNRKSVEEALGQ